MSATCSCNECVSIVRMGLWDGGHAATTWLPADPLIRGVADRGGIGECGPTTTDRRAYYRAVTTGRVRDVIADRLAHELLGVHPVAVWGDAWWISPEKSHSPAPIDPQATCGAVNA